MIDSEECFNQGKACRIVKLYDFEMYFKQLKKKQKSIVMLRLFFFNMVNNEISLNLFN